VSAVGEQGVGAGSRRRGYGRWRGGVLVVGEQVVSGEEVVVTFGREMMGCQREKEKMGRGEGGEVEER
jgi:hypothetical protein